MDCISHDARAVCVSKMAAFICIVVALYATVTAAHPASRFYLGPQPHQFNPIDYFQDNSEVPNYYTQPQEKQASANGAPSRLETLDPDSEVELVPGVQQPQPQPPQQNPVAPPNLPGFVPGQRVFIVHMPVPGYRPGTIGGYQPVYIVAASPQGNPGQYPVVGYQQNAILLDPSSVRLMPVNHGIFRPVGPQQNPGFFVGSAAFQKPYEIYPDPPNVAYRQPTTPQEGSQEVVRLTPQVENQSTHPTADANANAQKATSMQPKRVSQASQASQANESKEQKEDLRRYRPIPPLPSSRPTS